jgi:dTDP-4-dehydrorhamnose 3,5-epimerase
MLRTKLKLAVHQTPLRDLLIIEHNVFRDERGWFYESFNQKEFNSATGINYQFVQDNHSQSKQGILRGLHYQTQHTQGKLVRVTQGCVFDVAVDLRKESSSYGKWHGQELSADNQLQMWIPPGFAHGFLTLSETAEFLYKTTDYYYPEYDNCLLWNDPIVNIQWPLHRILRKPQLSEKDSEGAAWDDAKKF